jgi:type I restriction enzyme, S subunit
MGGDRPPRTTFATLIAEGVLEIGDGYRAKNEELGGDGLIFLRAGHVQDTSIDFEGAERFHSRLETRIRNKLAKAGDAVITTKGNSTGRTMYVSSAMPPFVYSPHLSYWRGLDPQRISGRFLHYWSNSPEFQEQLAGMKASTDMAPYLSLIDQKRLQISLPSICEQRAIAHILGTLDDKIELNRRMNETLEAMARALFTSWFVDFDPVRAKAEGRDPGLAKPLADLFPSRLVDSDLSEIPEAWSAVPLYDMAAYVNGAAYSAFQPNGERRGLPIIKIAELKAGVTPQTKFSDVRMPKKYRINRGDILFSWSGNPDTSIDTFVWPHDSAWLNQHIFRVVPHCAQERAFVLTLLKHLRPVFAEIARDKQTTGLGHVTSADLKRLLVVRPSDGVMRAWNATAAALLDRAFQNEVEVHSVATLRDTLLPKLLSGNLRLRETKYFLTEATT